MLIAGERIFVNLTQLLQTPLGRNIADVFLTAIDPETVKVVRELLKDPRFSHIEKMTLRERFNLMQVVIPLVRNVIYDTFSPVRGRARLENIIDSALDDHPIALYFCKKPFGTGCCFWSYIEFHAG